MIFAVRGPGHSLFTIAHFKNVWEGLQYSLWIDRLIVPLIIMANNMNRRIDGHTLYKQSKCSLNDR